MPSTDDANRSIDMLSEVKSFESKIGLPKGFCKKLHKEDDWSFVIKLKALFKAACTEALFVTLNVSQLREIISKIDYAITNYGKIKMLKALGLIDAEEYKTLNELAKLRNKLAHRILEVSFQFDNYICLMVKQQFKNTPTMSHPAPTSVELPNNRSVHSGGAKTSMKALLPIISTSRPIPLSLIRASRG